MNTILLFILIILVLILLFWLIFGINWRSMRNYKRLHNSLQARMMEENTDALRHFLFAGNDTANIETAYKPLSELLTRHGRPTASTADYEIISSGKRKFELLMRDISNATESIHMEYFHFGIDKYSRQIRKMLMQKAREGVKVRFINENIANFPIPNGYYYAMRRAGVDVINFSNTGFSLLLFLMSLSYRDHRKIVVIDGRIGYTGGMNITENYFRRWRDTHVRLTGKAVSGLQYAFLDIWLAGGGKLDTPLIDCFPAVYSPESVTPGHTITQITPDDPTSPEPLLLSAYEWILAHAQHYVWFQTPYLAPPDSLIQAIKNAVQRGVEVRVMVPFRCDTAIMRPINKAYYPILAHAGAHLYLRSGEFIHSKTILADDYLCSIGSTNLDYRSFGIDFELNTFFFDKNAAKHQKELFLTDMENCHHITVEELQTTLWQRIMRHLAPIL